MKKIVAITLAILMTMSIFTLTSLADNDIQVTVNGENIAFDQSPVVVDGRTLVPVRAVCEKLGADVYWYDAKQSILVIKNSLKLSMIVDKPLLTINTFENFADMLEKAKDPNYKPNEITLDVAPQIINGRTMLPIRAVCEALGAQVGWDSETSTVVITCPQEIIDDKNRDTTFFDQAKAASETAPDGN